jgi:agmatinase
MHDNYLGLEEKYSKFSTSKIVILPVPFDKSTTYIHGTNKGPQAIIQASKNLELYDIETDKEIYKKGIFTAKEKEYDTFKDLLKDVSEDVLNYLKQDKFVITLGGEHSISLAPIKAHQSYYKNISVLHFDAHLDTRQAYENNPYSHASVMARVKELENTSNIVSVGIRSMDIEEKDNLEPVNVFFSHELFENDNWMDKAINRLEDTVYITFDLDVFDSSLMPSTGTPEPGGMFWHQVMKFLKKVSLRKKIIGFDVVELCPIKNFIAPDFLAAKLIYKLINYVFIKD